MLAVLNFILPWNQRDRMKFRNVVHYLIGKGIVIALLIGWFSFSTGFRYNSIKPHLAFHLRNLFSICRIIYSCYHSRLLKRIISSNVIACSSKVFCFATLSPNIPSIRQALDLNYNNPFRLTWAGVRVQNSPRNHFTSGRMFLCSSPFYHIKTSLFLLQNARSCLYGMADRAYIVAREFIILMKERLDLIKVCCKFRLKSCFFNFF